MIQTGGDYMGYLFKVWMLRQIRKPKTLVTIMIGLIGFILILLGGSNNVLFGIGISLLSSGIVALISFLFLYDEDSFRSVKEWGLECVYRTRGEMNASCDEFMKSAKSIKAIGFGFKSLRDSQEGQILNILRKGGTIQIITMKPECDALKIRETDEGQNIGESIRDLIKWANKVNSMNLPGRIEIRYHDHLPPDFVFIMNNRLFTGPYEYGKISQQTISFEYRLTGYAYEYYEKYFDQLWNDKRFCADAF